MRRLIPLAFLVSLISASPVSATQTVSYSGSASYNHHFVVNFMTYRAGSISVIAAYGPIKNNTAAVVWLIAADGRLCSDSEDGRWGRPISGSVACSLDAVPAGSQRVEFWPWSGGSLQAAISVTGETDP